MRTGHAPRSGSTRARRSRCSSPTCSGCRARADRGEARELREPRDRRAAAVSAPPLGAAAAARARGSRSPPTCSCPAGPFPPDERRVILVQRGQTLREVAEELQRVGLLRGTLGLPGARAR